MDKEGITAAFSGLSTEWKKLLGVDLRTQLIDSIYNVNKHMASRGLSADKLTPAPHMVFHWARLCPFNRVKVVLLGQDPYIGPGEAMGLSFSTYSKKLPPSLRNIYNCLGISSDSGDLTEWARQGVLLLNSGLTTVLGESKAHVGFWAAYTDKLISLISQANPSAIFILLGNDAKAKQGLINTSCTVLSWGHPSPLNTANRTDTPQNFRYCDCFKRTNEILVNANKTPIDWNIFGQTVYPRAAITGDLESPIRSDIIYIFADGGCTGNGFANAKASYGFFVVQGKLIIEGCAKVPEKNLGTKYTVSNNRGELLAIYNGLLAARSLYGNILVVSDSRYSIDCITQWARKWFDDPETLAKKKNTDIIGDILKLIDKYTSENISIEFKHINSHTQMPDDPVELFYWRGNDIVDKKCTSVIQS